MKGKKYKRKAKAYSLYYPMSTQTTLLGKLLGILRVYNNFPHY